MGRLSKVLALVVIVATFASCGLFRRSTKKVEKHKLEVVTKRDSSLSEKTQKESVHRNVKVDQGVIVTERETTTTTELKGGKASGSVGLDKLRSGAELLLKDSAGFRISAILDTVNNRLSVKAEAPSGKSTKHERERITEQKNTSESNEKQGSDKVEKQVATSQEHRQKESASTEEVNKEPKGSIWIWVSAGALLFVIGLIWFLRRK